MDKYGLVVRDVPDVLSTLLKCLGALEKYALDKRLQGGSAEAIAVIDGASFLVLKTLYCLTHIVKQSFKLEFIKLEMPLGSRLLVLLG